VERNTYPKNRERERVIIIILINNLIRHYGKPNKPIILTIELIMNLTFRTRPNKFNLTHLCLITKIITLLSNTFRE
jgi:hypothetical protein